MPLYDYACQPCAWREERHVKLADFDQPQTCPRCNGPMVRRVSAVYGRMAGRVLQGGGPDRFTADMMGCRVDELPTGLRADK
jgi:putative FmdB family regulatory protein